MLMVNGGGKAKDETVVTVESGDILSELTAKLNEQNGTDYTYEEIALLNGITDPDTIYAGQTIVFPGTRQPESGSDSGSSGPGSGSDSSGGSFGSGSNDSSSTNNELSYFYSPIYKEKVDKLRRTQGITGNAMGRKKIVGKGAWEVTKTNATNVAPNQTMTVTENLKLRSGEATSTKVLSVMAAGTKVRILEVGKAETIDGIKSNWVKVEVQKNAKDRDGKAIKAGTVGWCYGGYLR